MINFFGPGSRLKIRALEDGYVVSFVVPEKYKRTLNSRRKELIDLEKEFEHEDKLPDH